MATIRRPERLLSYVTGRPWMIDEAKANEILAFLDFRAHGGVRSEEEIRALTSQKRLEPAASGAGVAVIPLFGVIAQRPSGMDQSSGFASLERFMGHFREAMADPGIGHIVMHIDSPGGSVDGIAEAADEIFAARGKKKLTSVADPLMASAAYAIGSAAQTVVASPSSMLGSIGVIAVHTEFSKAEEAAGIGVTVITSGKYKGEGNMHEPLSEDAEAHFQETCDDYYTLFVKGVARHRGVKPDQVIKGFGQGRALTAQRAVEANLADRVATLDQVLAELGVSRRRVEGASQEDATPALAALDGPTRISATPAPTAGQHIVIPAGPLADRALATRLLEGVSSTTDRIVYPTEIETPDAPVDAAAAPCVSTDSEPQRQEEHMPENGSGPQNEAGAGTTTAPSSAELVKQERQRARDITALATQHGMADRADGWIDSGMSADAVGRAILNLKGEATKTTALAPRPKEEAAVPTVIQRRSSSMEEEPGFELGMRMLALAAAGRAMRQGHALDQARWVEEGGFPKIASAMRSDRADAGGSFVAPNYLASEFIELLRPMSAVRSLSPRFIPLEGGTATIPKLTGGSTSAYKQEAGRGTASEGTSGSIILVAKELMTFVPMTYQFLNRATPEAAVMMRDDALAASAQRSDLAFIRGDGLVNTPKGLRNLALAGNVLAMTATPDLADTTTDLGRLRLSLENANVRLTRPGWIMAPRTQNWLRTIRDGNGNFAFREEMNAGRLDGFPYKVTTQIPTNLGGGTESELYFADFADVLLGEEPSMQIDIFDQVTYYDGANWQSAAQNNEVVLRIVEHHDIGLRHDASVAVLTGVTWGA